MCYLFSEIGAHLKSNAFDQSNNEAVDELLSSREILHLRGMSLEQGWQRWGTAAEQSLDSLSIIDKQAICDLVLDVITRAAEREDCSGDLLSAVQKLLAD